MPSGSSPDADRDARWVDDGGAVPPEATLDATEADAAAMARVERLAFWLDSRFRIPIIGRRIGFDGLIGLIPGIGDGATLLLSAYIIVEAWRLGVPPAMLARMAANVGIDSVIGAVPLVGDLFDMAWKSNNRNARLLMRHLQNRSRR